MKVGIIGLGYVGIQLAVGLGRKRRVIGLDLDARKVKDYQAGYDATGEVSKDQLRAADQLEFTTQPLDLQGCRYLSSRCRHRWIRCVIRISVRC